jgi:hypothetical protein
MTAAMRSRLVAPVVLAGALLLGGCGGSPTPAGQAAPTLSDRLDAVDAAIVGHHWEKARTQLDLLEGETVAAHESGDITVDQANRIQAAAADLAGRLPRG